MSVKNLRESWCGEPSLVVELVAMSVLGGRVRSGRAFHTQWGMKCTPILHAIHGVTGRSGSGWRWAWREPLDVWSETLRLDMNRTSVRSSMSCRLLLLPSRFRGGILAWRG